MWKIIDMFPQGQHEKFCPSTHCTTEAEVWFCPSYNFNTCSTKEWWKLLLSEAFLQLKCNKLILYCYSSCCCCCSSSSSFVLGVTLFEKKPRALSFQIGSEWNLAGLFFKWIFTNRQSRIFDLTSHFQDGGHDVHPVSTAAYAAASAGCLIAHQVLRYFGKYPPVGSACYHWVCVWCHLLYALQFLIHSTFVLVTTVHPVIMWHSARPHHASPSAAVVSGASQTRHLRSRRHRQLWPAAEAETCLSSRPATGRQDYRCLDHHRWNQYRWIITLHKLISANQSVFVYRWQYMNEALRQSKGKGFSNHCAILIPSPRRATESLV